MAILLCLVRTYLPRSGCVFDPPLVAFHDHRWPVLRALGAPSRPFCALVGWFRSSFSRTQSVMIPYLRGIRYGPGSEGCATVDATTTVVAMEVLPSARKHGVSDEDIRHAYANAIVAITTPDQPDFTMYVGPDGAGRLFEIGVLSDADDDFVIHAMSARPKYLKLIESTRRDNS